jgi:hypothetical protein
VSKFEFVEDGEPTTSTVVELSDVSPDKDNFAKFSGYFDASHIEHDIFVDAWDDGSIVKGTVDAWSYDAWSYDAWSYDAWS